ncbi:O-antigen/teichoic acid export membrane protein [Methylosinus sp. sav-2]|uniref:lipopolysaccharide biosynthesis protein n=1 Tax=Methylosinus sp. sav-2 TaxID=2485168 RepID=UPI00047ACC77|nr:hypothetical protein [Methylosinus sp. sav-2]TDX62139.1 O-antigen/teichoic acid export membrane protein [Methylosinus sp. sav-2]
MSFTLNALSAKVSGLLARGGTDLAAAERERRALLSAATAAGAKLITVGSFLISVPLTLGYLGAERYGLWMTMSSVVYVLSFADVGTGSALLNFVADFNGRDDRRGIREAVSTSAALLGIFGLLVAATFLLLDFVVPWAALLKIQSPVVQAEFGPGLLVVACCFALSLPLGVTARLQAGLQEGYRANVWSAAGGVLGLIGVWTAIQNHAGLPILALALSGAPLVVAAINAAAFFGGRGRDYAPAWRCVSLPLARRILGQFLAFLGIQIVVAINVASDNLIISKMLGPEAVTAFSVPERMFGLITMVIHLAIAPLWPAFGEALSRGDKRWLILTFKRSLLFTFVASVAGSTIFVFGGRSIIEFWSGGAVLPSIGFLLGLAVWKFSEAFENPLTVFLSSAGKIQPILQIGAVVVGVTIFLKISAISTFGFWIIPWISGVIRIAFSTIPLFYICKKFIDRL